MGQPIEVQEEVQIEEEAGNGSVGPAGAESSVSKILPEKRTRRPPGWLDEFVTA